MSKPGVMFYFDIRPCIKRLTLEEKGVLFEAILDYAELGVVPELDGVLGVAWDFIQPKLDRDSGQYDRKVEQKQYAVFVREVKKSGGIPPTFEEWRGVSDIECNQLISTDIERYPTSTSTITSTSTSTSKENMVADKPPTRHKFSPPTVNEVKTYCQEQGYSVDAERFVSYYESNGWMVGRNKMKNWQAAVRNWNGKEQKGNGTAEPEKPTWTVGHYV